MTGSRKILNDIKVYETEAFEADYDLKLDANENLFGPSPKVMDAIKNLRASDIYTYPTYGELRQKLADLNNKNIDNILTTNGADEAIYAVFNTFLESDECILTACPTFTMPKIYSKIIGAKFIEVLYKKRWEFPIGEFLEQMKNDKIKVLHLTTPNNPTGDVISKTDMKRILDNSKGKIVLIDEVYANFSKISYSEFLDDYENIIIVRSFSKDFALAGLRLGYMVASKTLIDEVKKVLSPYNVNNIAVLAGIKALEDIEHFEHQQKDFKRAKEELTTLFKNLGGVVYESFANFLCVDFSKKAEFVYKKLLKNKIKVRFFGYNEQLIGTLRITIPPLNQVEKIKKALSINDLIVFDMDGVLVDPSNSYRVAIEHTYQHFANKRLDVAEIQAAKNLGGLNNDWDLTEYLLKKDGFHIDKKTIIEKFQEIYWQAGKGLINDEKLVLDKNILNELYKKYDLAIFTGRPKAEAIHTLELNGIKDLFYPIITMDDLPYNKQKPDIQGILDIKAETIANKIYYLGDTFDDMICAKNSSVVGVGVLPPAFKCDRTLKDGLIKNGAVIVLDDVNSISTALEKF